MSSVLRTSALAILAAAAVGCGGEQPPLVPVHGRVTFQGRPAANILLHFIPIDGRPSVAMTDANGAFPSVKYNQERNGLLVGEYAVVLQYQPPEPEPGQHRPATPPQPPEELRPLFAKYGDFQKPQITERITPETRELVFTLSE